MLFTGGYILHHVLENLRPSWKPPYTFRGVTPPLSSSAKRAFLCALQSGAVGKLPIPFAVGSASICVDTGASASISNCRDDFVSLKPITNLNLKGIATGLPIAGIGTLNWNISTDSGSIIALQLCNALYVPQCLMNLLSPQQLAQQTKCSSDGFQAFANDGLL
jgi:hypothetical protein